jgi:outer membrane protein OmpA-like peptidoglycan-associated protein
MTRLKTLTPAALLLLLPVPGLAQSCPLEPLQRARSAPEAAAAHAIIMQAGAACDAGQRDWASRLTAARHLQVANQLATARRPATEVMAAVDASLRFAEIWQAYAMRGDLRQTMRDAAGQRDYAAASLDYQFALNAIEAGDERTDPVPREVIASLFRKAEQTRMLAERAIASPPTRSGRPGGLATRQIRSFVAESVAMPIQFEFGTANVTSGGARAALDLAAMLEAEGRPPILLVGHTDPVGSSEANRALSLRRAAAVGTFLVQRGYDPQRIQIEGRGEDAPLQIENKDGYTTPEIHQILRRVELVRR